MKPFVFSLCLLFFLLCKKVCGRGGRGNGSSSPPQFCWPWGYFRSVFWMAVVFYKCTDYALGWCQTFLFSASYFISSMDERRKIFFFCSVKNNMPWKIYISGIIVDFTLCDWIMISPLSNFSVFVVAILSGLKAENAFLKMKALL